MESNGKGVTRQGKTLAYPGGSIVWGSAGTLGQHSFHQLLHQGSHLVPVDIIVPLMPAVPLSENAALQHRQLVANALAQGQTLLYGHSLRQIQRELKVQGLSPKEINRLAPHKVIPGNRPHNLVTCDRLDAATLGALVALYEHKVYVESVILDINAFDQWGVELGKQLGTAIEQNLADTEVSFAEPALRDIVARYRQLRDGEST